MKHFFLNSSWQKLVGFQRFGRVGGAWSWERCNSVPEEVHKHISPFDGEGVSPYVPNGVWCYYYLIVFPREADYLQFGGAADPLWFIRGSKIKVTIGMWKLLAPHLEGVLIVRGLKLPMADGRSTDDPTGDSILRTSSWSMCIFNWGQMSCKGQPEVNLPRNALWLPNLGKRTIDQSQIHIWVKCHAKVNQRSICLRCPMTTKLGQKNLDYLVIHAWGQRSRKVNQRSICLGTCYGYKI